MNPAASGGHQGFSDAVGHAAGLPDIKDHLYVVTGQLNIADQGLHHVVRFRQQLELVAFYAANALTPFAQLEQGFGHRAVIFREDMFAGFEVV